VRTGWPIYADLYPLLSVCYVHVNADLHHTEDLLSTHADGSHRCVARVQTYYFIRYDWKDIPVVSTLGIPLKIAYDRSVRRSVRLACRLRSCTVCGYSTKYFSSVQVHARTHTNEKPFVCSFCPYASAQLSNLKKHVAIHLKKEAVARADAARVAAKLRHPSDLDEDGNGLLELGDSVGGNATDAKPRVLTRRAVALSTQARCRLRDLPRFPYECVWCVGFRGRMTPKGKGTAWKGHKNASMSASGQR
jgi:hypothetical protein